MAWARNCHDLPVQMCKSYCNLPVRNFHASILYKFDTIIQISASDSLVILCNNCSQLEALLIGIANHLHLTKATFGWLYPIYWLVCVFVGCISCIIISHEISTYPQEVDGFICHDCIYDPHCNPFHWMETRSTIATYHWGQSPFAIPIMFAN